MRSPDRLRILYGQPDGRWLLAAFTYPHGQHTPAPANIGDLARLGEPEAALAQLYERIRQRQQRDTERARAARRQHRTALRAWEAAEPTTRGPAPEPPPEWQPAKRGPRPGVQQQLGELLGVGQQAVSRYLSGKSSMEITDDGWRALVRAWFDTEEEDGYCTLNEALTGRGDGKVVR